MKQYYAFRTAFSVLAVAMLLAVTSCGPDQETRSDITSIIKANAEALQNENIQGVVETIHPDSPLYPDVLDATESLFAQYDLTYEINSMKIISLTEDKAEVKAIQTTTKRTGPAFKDNKATIVHELRKHGDKWLIWKSTIKEIEYL